ncbi:MAG: GntR family transcriptional regulator [Thermomicrobiales bacterium]
MASGAVTQSDENETGRRLRQPTGLRLIDDVAHSIEDAILAGQMRPGERLIETRLCDELGVSRTTLREALLTLQHRGLVRNEPRRGTFVTRLSRQDSLDLCKARALLEAYAVSAGYERLTPDDFAAMQAIVDELQACEFPQDVPKVIQLDHAFHEHVMQALDSPGIHALWSSQNGRMSALILSSIEHHHAGTPDVAMFHQVLLDALRSGDVEIARDAVVAHYIGSGFGDERSLHEIARAIESVAHPNIA